MKIEDLSLFSTVSEYKSQSAAARVLGIPVSKVCSHIAMLEQHLGTCLIERTTPSLLLTDAGIELLERSKKILAEVEALKLSVGQRQIQPEGTVTVAAPLDFINRTCNEALTLFYQRYPALRLKFISYQNGQNPMNVQADLVIFIGNRSLPGCSMAGHKLITFDCSFVASPDFISKNLKLTHPRQLPNYPCLLAKGARPADTWYWTKNNKPYSIDVSGPFESDSIDLCISGAIHGQGIAWVPPLMCLDHLKAGRLKLLFDGQYAHDVSLWGLYSNRHYLPCRVRTVLDFFQQQFIRLQQQLKDIL